MNTKQLNAILNNEACQLCGRKAKEKCMVCLMDGQTACYHREHHLEKLHQPIWISVYD